jgi:hypothetical protein
VRPTGPESVRAIQAALAEIIVPELASAFAQDAATTAQMLLESIAGQWDTAAEDLRNDNKALRALLSTSRDAIKEGAGGNENLASIVSEIESRLHEKEDGSLTLTNLASRNDSLRATLERILVTFEDLTSEAGLEEIDAVRRNIFAHLRDVATRGWSFWDVSSFRGRMAAVRSGAAMDDARATREVQ